MVTPSSSSSACALGRRLVASRPFFASFLVAQRRDTIQTDAAPPRPLPPDAARSHAERGAAVTSAGCLRTAFGSGGSAGAAPGQRTRLRLLHGSANRPSGPVLVAAAAVADPMPPRNKALSLLETLVTPGAQPGIKGASAGGRTLSRGGVVPLRAWPGRGPEGRPPTGCRRRQPASHHCARCALNPRRATKPHLPRGSSDCACCVPWSYVGFETPSDFVARRCRGVGAAAAVRCGQAGRQAAQAAFPGHEHCSN